MSKAKKPEEREFKRFDVSSLPPYTEEERKKRFPTSPPLGMYELIALKKAKNAKNSK